MNKKLRATIYCMMLAEIDNQLFGKTLYEFGSFDSKSSGFCFMLRQLFEIDTYANNEFEELLPELYSQKSKQLTLPGYWWNTTEDGWKMRRKALVNALKSM